MIASGRMPSVELRHGSAQKGVHAVEPVFSALFKNLGTSPSGAPRERWDKKTSQANCLGDRLFLCVWGSMIAYENLQLLAHFRLNLWWPAVRQISNETDYQIQLHRSHWATASGEEEEKEGGEDWRGDRGQLWKDEGDKTEDRGQRQRNREGCGKIKTEETERWRERRNDMTGKRL